MPIYDVIQNALNKKVVCRNPPCSYNPPQPIKKSIPKRRKLGEALRRNSNRISGNSIICNTTDNASNNNINDFSNFNIFLSLD